MRIDTDPRLPNVPDVPRLITRLYDLLRQIISAANRHEDGYVCAAVSVSANYTVQLGDGAVLVNAATGARAITLQQPGEAKGKFLVVRKTEASANNVTLTPPSGQIDGAASLVLTAAAPRAMLVSDGTNYFTV